MTTKTWRRRCSCCKKLKVSVHPVSTLCESCEADHVECVICEEWFSKESDLCRHLGWDAGLGCYAGCGTYGIDAEDHKESFLLLLDRLAPLGEYLDGAKLMLPKMLAYIEANNFWTTWHGPLIGGLPDLELRYSLDVERGTKPGTYSSMAICDIKSRTMEKWDAEGDGVIDGLQLGMTWLTSLDNESVEANRLTAGWIREWQAAHQN
jgi:hypothetical protein